MPRAFPLALPVLCLLALPAAADHHLAGQEHTPPPPNPDQLTQAQKHEYGQKLHGLNQAMRRIEDQLPPEHRGLDISAGALSVFTQAYKEDAPPHIINAISAFEGRLAGLPEDQRKQILTPILEAVMPRVMQLQGTPPGGAGQGLAQGLRTTGDPTTMPGANDKPNIRGGLLQPAILHSVTPEAVAMIVTAPGPAPHDKVVEAATIAIEGGVKDPAVFLVRGQSAEKLGDYQLAHRDAAYAYQADPSNRAAESLYRLTRDRPSRVRLLDPEKIQGDDGRLAAAGLGAGAAKAQWDGRTPGAGAAAADRPERPEPFGMAPLSPEALAAQENAALNARPVTAKSAELTRDAKAALKVGDTNTALRLTEEAIASDPGNADARYVRATTFLRLRQPAQAQVEASAGLELAPGNAPLLYTRAVANGRQKLWREAYVDAEDAVRNAPRAGYAYQVRAAANWALGRKAEMTQDLQRSASLDRAYAASLQRASQLPADVDPTLLFGDMPQSAAPAAAPAPAPASGGRYALWGVGAALAALGLAPLLFPGVRKRVTTVLRRGPAVVEEEPGEGGAEVPLSGFWRRYEVTREIGAGGMGVVYEAWDRQLERRVAVKRMRDEIKNDRRERERFLQEARVVARLRHPNLVEIYSIEEDGPEAYLVFEFVEGSNLHELIQSRGRLTPAEAREVFRGICAGVDYAHRQSIVHRDLKPANVIVQNDGPVKVMDFGIARQAQDALMRRAMTNTIIGTPQYMAPEQEEGVVCAQSDVYALGVCLYEALSGAIPFSGTPGAVTLAKREGRYEPLSRRNSDIPPALSAVVDRALEPDPARRIQSAAEFMKELDAAVSGVGV